jgi:hypothetical protein
VTFSVGGLLVSVAVLLPTLLLLPFPPKGSPDVPPRVGWPLASLEKVGQVGCLVAPALGSGGVVRNGWLVLVVACIAAYYGLWVRYFWRNRRFAALYEPLMVSLGTRRPVVVPVPMAVFPVMAFIGTALWLSSWWVAASALALAVGHIGSALRIARATERTTDHIKTDHIKGDVGL